MINRDMLYLILYALAARNGREAALFGDCASLAHEAFTRSLAGEAFPTLWFELPLMGEPWFDLHVLASRDDLSADMRFLACETGGQSELFAWFVQEKHAAVVKQLALSYDVSRGDIDRPAVQLLVRAKDTDVVCEFLEVADRPDLAPAYRDFASRIPQDWFACYTGVFPGRPEMGLRVECIPHPSRYLAYAQDVSLLAADLRAAGLQDPSNRLLEYCTRLAPWRLEFQFDLDEHGVVGPTFGTSVHCDSLVGPKNARLYDPNGAAGAIFGMVENWGLADDRWHLLDDLAFAKNVSHEGDTRCLYCCPSMIKLRWRDGMPVDAKLYIEAGVRTPIRNTLDDGAVSSGIAADATSPEEHT
ncbi:MAG: hypothetical protein Q4A07_02285 [Coriobacteriales bacterium]|nr:hypothetical protein [Coriobacteriales bacterium]